MFSGTTAPIKSESAGIGRDWKRDDEGTLLRTLPVSTISATLKDVNYSVVDKSFLEQILDVEFRDPAEHGYFYKDNGHSFDSLFFFGNEIMLIVFEMLFFGLVDLGTNDYLFTGAMQYLLMEVLLRRLRDSLGKKNLARKTLVDKRFLI